MEVQNEFGKVATLAPVQDAIAHCTMAERTRSQAVGLGLTVRQDGTSRKPQLKETWWRESNNGEEYDSATHKAQGELFFARANRGWDGLDLDPARSAPEPHESSSPAAAA
jgi:hypothetical protein